MKNKSTSVNYDKLYYILGLAITFCLFYVSVNLFLPLANYLTLISLAVGLLFFVLAVIFKKKYYIVASLCFILLSIGLVIAFKFYV